VSREYFEKLSKIADLKQETEIVPGFYALRADGASKGNPGPAGAGAVLYTPPGVILAQSSLYLGRRTNNVAEYSALLLGLALARSYGLTQLEIFMDSELTVRQITGAYRVNSPGLLPYYSEAKRQLASLEKFRISHVYRDSNQEADQLASRAAQEGAVSNSL
jgi:ribonuclease HI